MSDADQPTTAARELFAHLLPLQGVSLLLPKPAVIEIQGMDAVDLETGGPAWFLGFADWNGQRLPVISIEALAGGTPPARSRRTRLAVVNSLGTVLEYGLFMVVIQGYPHLTALTPSVLRPRPDLAEDAEVALCRVRLGNTDAIIPDLEQIETRLSEVVVGLEEAAEAATDWEPSR